MQCLSLRSLLLMACMACCGCAQPLREVMLIVTTDIDCTQIDRVQIVVARGTPDNVTYQQTFVRSECMVTPAPALPQVVLSNGAQLRLGVQDSQNSTQPLYVQVNGYLGSMLFLSTSAETDFVNNEVYGLPLTLVSACIPVTCIAPGTCRVDPNSGGTVCAEIFRAPGSDGLTPAPGNDP